jgi:hypothetical protein
VTAAIASGGKNFCRYCEMWEISVEGMTLAVGMPFFIPIT